MTVVHVGWVDSPVPEEEQASLAARLLTDHDCIAVFLPPAMADGYYSGFCKGTLWPLLHYSQVRNFNEAWWEVRDTPSISSPLTPRQRYQQANYEFARVIHRHMSADYSALWVQDYHLFLLPGQLRREIAEGLCPKIGFFLHSPFPSSEIFRTSPVRAELLTGLLGARLSVTDRVTYPV